MLSVILVGALFSGAVSLLIIRVGNARIERRVRADQRPRKPAAMPIEVRLIPRRENPQAG
jgi:hypothetical protein